MRLLWSIVLGQLLLWQSFDIVRGLEDPSSRLVQEVLDDAQQHFDYDNNNEDASVDEGENHRHQQQVEDEEWTRIRQQERLDEEERIVRQRIQFEREAAFEKELRQLSKEHQRKAQHQKRIDGRVVRKVLAAATREDYYGVLGLRNLEIIVPSQKIHIWTLAEITIPGFNLLRIPVKAIRRAYRTQAVLVHPDKNRDGRAHEAFMAVEHAASLLSDDLQRTQYDQHLQQNRQQHLDRVKNMATGAIMTTTRVTFQFTQLIRRALGPFMIPTLILGSLIV